MSKYIRTLREHINSSRAICVSDIWLKELNAKINVIHRGGRAGKGLPSVPNTTTTNTASSLLEELILNSLFEAEASSQLQIPEMGTVRAFLLKRLDMEFTHQAFQGLHTVLHSFDPQQQAIDEFLTLSSLAEEEVLF